MYKSLDIITNKVTAEEQSLCVHHMLSVLSPLSENNTVVNFRDMALPVIDGLLDAGKVPIIVGGTNYYIESLLWNFLIDTQTVEQASQVNSLLDAGTLTPVEKNLNLTSRAASVADHKTLGEQGISKSTNHSSSKHLSNRRSSEPNCMQHLDWESSSSSEATEAPVEDAPPSEGEKSSFKTQSISEAKREKEGKYAVHGCGDLYRMLMTVDPEMAQRLHPKNRRKIVRALQVFDEHGVPLSQVHKTQHRCGNTPGLRGALRYNNCCVFWVHTQQAVLDKRLSDRVDNMLKQGLVSELHDLHQKYLDSVATRHGEPDYTLGIFQSIGFKEFHNYLVLPPDRRDSAEGQQHFQKGVEGLKIATRQYARRQLKWIKNRFLNCPGSSVPTVYGLDSTDVNRWSQTVFQPAVNILSAVIEGREVPIQPPPPDAGPCTVHIQNICGVCDGRVFTTLHEWQIHLSSRKHKKMQQHKHRLEKRLLDNQKGLESTGINTLS